MENNFYVGDISHKRRISKESYTEKMVLYNSNNDNYLDLINDKMYTTDKKEKDYVISSSLEIIDINDLKDDYHYLLIRHNDSHIKKKKKKFNFK